MERMLGRKFWLSSVTAFVLSTISVGADIAAWVGGWLLEVPLFRYIFGDSPDWSQWAVVPITAITAFLFWKPVWRLLWRTPFLGDKLADRVFPDLNGTWDVTFQSNWPMIRKMQQAAADKGLPEYDVSRLEKPEFQEEKATAVISQSWYGVSMEISRAGPNSKILRSVTIAFDLIGKTGTSPHKLAYVYDQENAYDNRDPLDSDGFLGGAMLSVSEDHNTLTGVYFTNRSWIKALNTAGSIILKRRA